MDWLVASIYKKLKTFNNEHLYNTYTHIDAKTKKTHGTWVMSSIELLLFFNIIKRTQKIH